MTWNDSPGDSFDPTHSASGLFNAAGVQVKGTCGSSFITDVIRIERNGVENAVKVLTESAARDPEILSRFLINARYNQALNEFTGMGIVEISEAPPRPYSVIQRVAQSSLLEVIRHHAPIEPNWLTNLLLPVARMLDTIHQRNVLHANIKPSNLLIVVENGQEYIKLVDFLDPSLAATSATITGAGVYAAPEFRAGMPVSNRSDIYSLAAVMYEAFAGYPPSGAHRKSDGTFHVWRNGDIPTELTQVNPEIDRDLSDVIMNAISPQAIARPATASALIEDSLRILNKPKMRHRPVEEKKPDVEHKPVPMLLIVIGVFIATLLVLFIGFKIASSLFGSGDKTPSSSTSQTTQQPTGKLTEKETALVGRLPSDQQSCTGITNNDEKNPWPKAEAVVGCVTLDVNNLRYGKFDSTDLLNDTFTQHEKALLKDVEDAGREVYATPAGKNPCQTQENERGTYSVKNNSTGEVKYKGKFVCVNIPYPQIVWTEEKSNVIGTAELPTGKVSDLGAWWAAKSGPQ